MIVIITIISVCIVVCMCAAVCTQVQASGGQIRSFGASSLILCLTVLRKDLSLD